MTVYLDPLENFVINLYVVVRTKRWNAQRFVFFALSTAEETICMKTIKMSMFFKIILIMEKFFHS